MPAVNYPPRNLPTVAAPEAAHVPPAPPAPLEQWEPLKQQIREYAGLEEDWDGQGGHAPQQQDIALAVSVIDDLKAMNLATLPALTPVGDGEIIIDWELGDRYLEISVQDEEICYIARQPDGKKLRGQCETTQLDDTVKDFLRAFIG